MKNKVGMFIWGVVLNAINAQQMLYLLNFLNIFFGVTVLFISHGVASSLHRFYHREKNK